MSGSRGAMKAYGEFVSQAAVDRLAEHPLPRMLERGLNVSVHSDDPSYFGGYLDANMAGLVDTFGLTRAQVATLAANSIRSSFLDEEAKNRLLADVDAWLTRP